MNLKKIFSSLLVLFPILYVYKSGISTLSVADVLLIAIIPILLIDIYKKRKNIHVSLILLIISFFMILQLLIYTEMGISSGSAFMTTLRVILYYLTCAIFVKDYFDLNFAINLYKKVAVISSLFLLFQFVLFNYFGLFIQGTIPGFETEVDKFNIIMNSHSWTSLAYARPRSFFSEPSHFAVYVSLAFAILLLYDKKKNWFMIITILLAMLLSGSGMATILCFLILTMFFIKSIKNLSRKTILYICGILMIAAFIIPYYTNSNSFKIFYNRTFVQKDSTNGRFGNFAKSFTLDKKDYQIVLGEGVYKIEDVEGQEYITSIPRIYTFFGLSGMLLFIILCIRNFYKLKGINLTSWIILLAISFASEILFHSLLFVFIPYIIARTEIRV